MSTSSIPAVVNVPTPFVAAPTVPTNPVSAFLKHHETLLIIVFGFLLLWFLSGKVENIIAAHDNANLQSAKVVASAQAEINAQKAELVAQQAADFKALNERLTAQDAALRQTNAALASALGKQQQLNNNLTVPELLTRWEQLVPGAGLSVTNGQATISDTGAHATVNELEKVPVLTKQLTNETQVAADTNALLAASTKQVFTLNERVNGLNLKIADDDKVCKAEIKTVKDAATKSKRRWFIGGFIAGFASRQAIKTYFGF